jgi:hypothetical protein
MDEIEDMAPDSSAEVDLDASATAGKPSGEVDNAISSAATDEIEADALSVVRNVVDQREAPEAETAPSAEGEEAGDDAGDGPSQTDSEDFSDVAFHKHPRFQQIVRERNSFREDAGRYRNVQTYLDDNGLSAEEAADGLMLMGMMKTDPIQAWKALKPRVQNLLVAAGEILPDDLAKRVEARELTRDGAFEINRAKAAQKAFEARQQFNQQREQRRGSNQLQRSIHDTVSTWETDRQLKDPNFTSKLPRIQEKIAFIHATEGVAKDVDSTKRQLKRAYDAVNKELSAVSPSQPQARALQRKPAVTPVRGGQVAANTRAEPRSTLDIVRAGRRQSA